MNPLIAITPATAADTETLLVLQQRAYQSEARLYNDWSLPPLTQSSASMREDISTMTVLKAVEKGSIIGSVRGVLRDGLCQIGRLIVAPERQSQGIGSALLDAIEARFPQAQAFELFTGSRSEGNLRLYRRHGYVETRRQQVAPHLTLVFLRKEIPRASA
jgi:ribosomal protein S18 acetylase RimI-like enzyme